ncbi:inhibitor of growth protein 3 isoform X1 [Hydra vulgaris]|uniref:Inhibitor of growth protein n=2 Tax=Hydra vulgaris TaxID=6087 RepID=T2M3T3_HYDVU|nr:inhibitor of growth protein 3 isoform X1 [Hydra vulgaris]
MLYLEDFIELIEQLPQDLRDRFTEMRELDLKVQNTIDTMDTRVRKFFTDARKSKPEEIEKEYENIHNCYKQALDDADEKVSMASQIYDLVDRHLRKLDQELGRFKMELEADCSGITEILEKRSTTNNEDNSLDLLYNIDSKSNQRRKFGDIERLSTAAIVNGFSNEKSTIYNSLSTTKSSFPPTTFSTPISTTSLVTSKLNGIGSNTLLQSNKMTDSLKEQGRGAQASLKAMTAAQKKAEQLVNSLSLSGLIAPSNKNPSNSTSSTTSSLFADVSNGSSSFAHKATPTLPASAISTARIQKSGRRGQKSITSSQPTSTQSETKHAGPSLDWVPDPNEPTYCLCNQVSYGEMVGCDNSACPVEWFHYGCVGLTDAPKGKWYCPDCAAQLKKKRIR